jgi:inhibitor of cysteine peptidase
LNSETLKKVHYQHVVFSIPKGLQRNFFCCMGCVTMAFMVFLLLSVTAFAETVLTEVDNGKTVRLGPQQEVLIVLPSNPTTGYSWEIVGQKEDAAVAVVSKEFKTSVDEPLRAGAGGLELFRLRLLKAGRFTVTFVYRRSWEKEQKPERTFCITMEQ